MSFSKYLRVIGKIERRKDFAILRLISRTQRSLFFLTIARNISFTISLKTIISSRWN